MQSTKHLYVCTGWYFHCFVYAYSFRLMVISRYMAMPTLSLELLRSCSNQTEEGWRFGSSSPRLAVKHAASPITLLMPISNEAVAGVYVGNRVDLAFPPPSTGSLISNCIGP